MNTDLRTKFIVLAEYQLYGEDGDGSMLDATEWMEETFRRGIDDNLILNGSVVHTIGGYWELQLITFEVEMMLHMRASTKALKRDARKKLNKMVADQDIDVRWVLRVGQNA